MTLIIVEPDTVREPCLQWIRFEAPYDVPWKRSDDDRSRYLTQYAKRAVDEAVRIKRLEKWDWLPNKGYIGPEPSPGQGDMEKVMAAGQAQSVHDRLEIDGMIDWRVGIWFLRPLDLVIQEAIRENRPGLNEGFAEVSPEYVDAHVRLTGKKPRGMKEEQ